MSNSEHDKFWGLIKHHRAKLKKCTTQRERDDAVGDFLEALVTFILRRHGLKVQRFKTHGLDMMASNPYGTRKDIAIECTNWAQNSWANTTYFNNKVSTLWSYYNNGCGALWITSFKTNFPSLKGKSQPKFIHFIELKKQFLPNQLPLRDYLSLKRRLKAELKKI
jgi:hypothetical protein